MIKIAPAVGTWTCSASQCSLLCFSVLREKSLFRSSGHSGKGDNPATGAPVVLTVGEELGRGDNPATGAPVILTVGEELGRGDNPATGAPVVLTLDLYLHICT